MNETTNKGANETSKGTEAFWRQHYEAFQVSGLSRASYSRQHQLTYHCFLYWCRKFNQTLATTGNDSSSVAANFLPVHIHSEEQSDSGALCTLELGSHQRLLIHTPMAIEMVLQVLRRNAC